MSDFTSSHPFDLTGEFSGIILTDAGKHRLLLRIGGAERLFKVPKWMRRRMAGNFRPGETVRVSGTEERDAFAGTSKWLASGVLPVDGAVAAPTLDAASSAPIRVCAKKDCWRHGGRELYDALEAGIEVHGLAGQVRLKAVNCLDRCKHGPNIDWGDQEYSRCTLRDTETILDRLTPPVPAAPLEAGS